MQTNNYFLKNAKRFLVLGVLLLSFSGLKSQITNQIIYPADGQVINDVCDLHFCMSSTDTLDNYGYFIKLDNPLYPYWYSHLQYDSTFCFYDLGFPRNLSGLTKFYLQKFISGGQGGFLNVDSVEININTPLPDPQITITQNTVNPYLADIVITGLPIVSTTTVNCYTNSNYYFGIHNSNSVISNTSTGGTYTTTILNTPNSGSAYPSFFFRFNYCNNSFYDTIRARITPPLGCNDYNLPSGLSAYSQGQGANYCQSDSITLYADFTLSPSIDSTGNSRYIINWGDGTIDTTAYAPNQSGYSILQNQKHKYLTPGSFGIFVTLEGDNTCFNSTIGEIVDIIACGNITGNVFYDADNDCSKTTGDVELQSELVILKQGNSYYTGSYTDANGNYSLTAPIGTYQIEIGSNNYDMTCANSLPHAITVASGNTYTENFALTCDGSYDVAIAGVGLSGGGLFPGTTSYLYPYLGLYNQACNFPATSATVKLILPPCLSSTSGTNYYYYSNLPDQIIPASTGDTLVWNTSTIDSLGSFNYWSYVAAVTTCTNAQVGDTACVTVMVSPIANDSDPSNNIYTHCFPIGVSYDPNNKEVLPRGEGPNGNVPLTTDKFTYTLNFQNTGTAPAHNIYLLDTLSTNFDLSTLEIIGSSHSMQTYMLPDNTVKFMFANIMLPDSTNNEPLSHGYVTYSIKPIANLALGTQFKNTGYIYFDYNVPVVTNTTINTFAALATGITNYNSNKLFNVYPNPANDRVVVKTNQTIGIIEIIDVLGKQIKKVNSTGLQTEINISDLQNGIYFIKTTSHNKVYTQKVIINK